MTYGIQISKAKAKQFNEGKPIPMGYERTIKVIDGHVLWLANYSGTYYLNCHSLSNDKIIEHFKLEELK